jgi:hypothetical protein
MGIKSIAHQIKLAVRRYKRYQSLSFEFIEPHALVELNVLQLN